MTIPTFSMSEWRGLDGYDPEELPTPGQSYVYPDAFAQRLYYHVVSNYIVANHELEND